MKKERNELLEFIGGLAMFVVGLYLFTNKVSVQSSLFMGVLKVGGLSVNSGLVVIPFIIGIIMIFVKPESFVSKLVAGCGLIIIVVSVIASTTIRLPRMSLYEWLLYLVLIFGGLALLCRVLFNDKNKNKDKDN